jgi:hypothetical protein
MVAQKTETREAPLVGVRRSKNVGGSANGFAIFDDGRIVRYADRPSEELRYNIKRGLLEIGTIKKLLDDGINQLKNDPEIRKADHKVVASSEEEVSAVDDVLKCLECEIISKTGDGKYPKAKRYTDGKWFESSAYDDTIKKYYKDVVNGKMRITIEANQILDKKTFHLIANKLLDAVDAQLALAATKRGKQSESPVQTVSPILQAEVKGE